MRTQSTRSPTSSRPILAATLLAALLLLVIGGGLGLFVQQRLAACASVPLIGTNILPNAALRPNPAQPALPNGWRAAAPGVQLGEFSLDADGRALQLMGLANYVETPPVPVQGGQRYCVTVRAITDTPLGSPTRVQLTAHWFDPQGQPIGSPRIAPPAPDSWQDVVLWQPDNPPDDWSYLRADLAAPPNAASLRVRVHPAADDRIYLDLLRVQRGGNATAWQPDPEPAPITILPWPGGKQAAVSFSFDWETAMGGLIHSRSVDDPNSDQDPLVRGMRMREGITTSLAIFAPYGIRATYFANGYNFLAGNPERREFMGNPTYAWANTANRWTSDQWQQQAWFAADPHGTIETHPEWYFADLIPLLRAANHDIQSHTFSHFYGGFVTAADWHADLQAWREVAAEQDVPPAVALAFPWSSSGGMSDASWHVLTEYGITTITRTSGQAQYNLFPRTVEGVVAEPHCRPLPAHPQITACPDFYLTPTSAARALTQIEQAVTTGGMIDLWAHTEEVITPEQQAAWQRVVHYAATHTQVWVAPLREISAWQRARDQLQVQPLELYEGDLRVQVQSANIMPELGILLPFEPERVQVTTPAGTPLTVRQDGARLLFEMPATTVEIRAWRKT